MTEPAVATDPGFVRFRQVHTEALLRRITRRYLVRMLGPGYWVAVAAALGAAIFLLVDGDRSWFLGVALTAAIFGVAMPLKAYRLHLRNALAALARLPDPASSEFAADAHGFTIENPLGRVSLPWKQLYRVLREPDAWLLLLAANQFVTVPLADASAQDLVRLEGYVRASGVPLR